MWLRVFTPFHLLNDSCKRTLRETVAGTPRSLVCSLLLNEALVRRMMDASVFRGPKNRETGVRGLRLLVYGPRGRRGTDA